MQERNLREIYLQKNSKLKVLRRNIYKSYLYVSTIAQITIT